MKSLKLLAIALILSCTAIAQDKIYQENGAVLEVRIVSVQPHTVVYTLWSETKGVEHSILKNDIKRIKYQDGHEEQFERDELMHRYFPDHQWYRSYDQTPMKLNGHVLSVAPIQFTENGFGIGLSYERSLGKNGIITYCLPLAFTINHPYKNNQHTDERNNDAMFYFSPGIKIYPTSYFGKLKYAVGPSLVIGAGRHTDVNDAYSYYYPTNYDNRVRNKFLVGILINNSVTANVNASFNVGFDFGFGFTYLSTLDGVRQGLNGMVQGGIKMGYRY